MGFVTSTVGNFRKLVETQRSQLYGCHYQVAPEPVSRKAAHNPCQDLVVIPAYDEARCIGSVVIQSRRFTSQVIVVDDGSTDDTAQIARSAGATLVCHERNQGKGTALNSGFRAARQFDPQVAGFQPILSTAL